MKKVNTLHLVPEDQQELASSLPAFSFSDDTLVAVREAAVNFLPNSATGVTIGERVEIKTATAELSVLIYKPESRSGDEKLPGIYYIHGGGYVMGTADMYDTQHQQKANVLNVIVVAIEYRIAPEFPFPTPLMDCVEGLNWLVEKAVSIGVDPERISIMGESAGGGLAAATTLYFTDKKIFTPKNQILIYPMLDYRT